MGQDIFSLGLLVQVFFLFRIALQEIFFKITTPPPPPQKLNDRSLKASFKEKKLIKMASFWFWITHKQRLLETGDTYGKILKFFFV